jgi:hypothetical protein
MENSEQSTTRKWEATLLNFQIRNAFPKGNSFFNELQLTLPAKRVGRFASGAFPDFRSRKKWFNDLSLAPVAGAGLATRTNNGDHNEKSFDSVNTSLSVHHLYHVLRAKFSEELRQW